MWVFLFLLHLKFSHLIYFRSNALPPLDWPLPSQFDQYELRIEVQPRPHHRAHYETEGSRGAVKAAPTGHPVVKVKMKFLRVFFSPLTELYDIRSNLRLTCLWSCSHDTGTNSLATAAGLIAVWFHTASLSIFTAVWLHREETALSSGFRWNSWWPINQTTSFLSDTQVLSCSIFLFKHKCFLHAIMFKEHKIQGTHHVTVVALTIVQ